MKTVTRLWLFLVTVVTLISVTGSVGAQTTDELSSVRVRLWPEYDEPTMLVIYDITLPAGTPLPAVLSIRIPRTAGDFHALASIEPDGSLFNLTVGSKVVSGDWIIIEFTATTLDSRLEFYDPALVKDGTSRHYEYRWPGDFNVKSLEIEVQQPVDATNMILSPGMGSGVLGGDGLLYFGTEVGSLQKGQSFQQDIDYSKATETLSTEMLTIEPVGSFDSGLNSSGAFSSLLPWLLFIGGLLLLAGVGYWFWHMGRKSSTPVRRPQRGSRKASKNKQAGQEKLSSSQVSATEVDESAVYCHQCGKRAMTGDRFCRICGSQLRT